MLKLWLLHGNAEKTCDIVKKEIFFLDYGETAQYGHKYLLTISNLAVVKSKMVTCKM